MAHIRFTQHGFHYLCNTCNNHEDITGLAQTLRMFGLEECPSHLYQAWKILRLGTKDYSDDVMTSRPGCSNLEHVIIQQAIKAVKERRQEQTGA